MPGPNTPSRLTLALLPAALVAATAAAAGTGHRNAATAEQKPGSIHVPLVFEANEGQTAEQVRFLSRGSGYTLFLTPTEAVMKFQHGASRKFEGHLDWRPEWAKAKSGDMLPRAESSVLRMKLLGSNPHPAISGVDALATTTHYLLGKGGARIDESVPTFGRVRYSAVYPGVDMVYYSKDRALEYDFVVAAGADPSAIRFRAGEKSRVNRDGSLAVSMSDGAVRFQRPTVYQEVAGHRQAVAAAYNLRANGEVGFRLGRYDHSRPLVIDPVVVYSTLLGGSGFDNAQAVAMDPQGNVYVAGYTESVDFPAAAALQSTSKGGGEAFVAKISSDGSKLLYSTYLGGTGQDAATGIALDPAGNVYVCGITDSTDFPVKNALQPTLGGATDAFVVCIDHNGTQVDYATYLGGAGSDGASRITVNAAGTAFVTGYTSSANFPVTGEAFQGRLQGEYDAFVAAVNPAGVGLSFSTYLGGSGPDSGAAIALYPATAQFPNGALLVAGTTDSNDFPSLNGIQSSFEGGRFGDSFATMLDFSGFPVFSTYWGGSGSDAGAAIVADEVGWIYLGLNTDSTDLSPAQPKVTPFQTSAQGGSDAYVMKFFPGEVPAAQLLLDSTGAPLPDGQNPRYFTYLGGAGNDVLRAMGVDGHLNPEDLTSVAKVYLFGETDSAAFPIDDPIQGTLAGQSNVFLTKLHEDLYLVSPQLETDYSTFLGGSGLDHAGDMAVDSVGNLAIAGNTSSTDFPLHRALSTRKSRQVNAFVAKMLTGVPQPGGSLQVPQKITFATAKSGKFLTHALVIRNLSQTQNLAVKIKAPNAPFTVSGGLIGVQLAPGGSVSYQVKFAPAGAGIFNGAISIATSDPQRPTANIILTGRGK